MVKVEFIELNAEPDDSKVSQPPAWRVQVDRRLLALLSQLEGCTEQDIQFGRTSQNKPYHTVAGEPATWHWNLSHCDDAACIALTQAGPVGVDVERVRPRPHHSDRLRWLNSAEKSWLTSTGGEAEYWRRFYRLWSSKEAVTKWLGIGLWQTVADIELVPDAEGQQFEVRSDRFDFSKLNIHTLMHGEWMVTVASTGGWVELSCDSEPFLR